MSQAEDPYFDLINKLFNSRYKNVNNSKEYEILLDSWPQLLIDKIESVTDNIVGEIPPSNVLSVEFKNPKRPDLGVVTVSLWDVMPINPGDRMMLVHNKDGQAKDVYVRDGVKGFMDAYTLTYKWVRELEPEEEESRSFKDELMSLNDSLPASLQQNDTKSLLSILKVILGGAFVTSELFK